MAPDTSARVISVLVPYGGGCPWRERAWDYVRAHYEREHADWELVVGTCEGEWSKGGALADAFCRSTGSILVVADADSFIAPSVLLEAVRLVADGQPWVVPHTYVQRLHRRHTEEVLAGASPRRGRNARPPYRGVIGGGIVVLNRQAWGTVGGVDERFRGWGGEDISFGWALETLIGPCVRLDGELWHLWHPHPAPRRRGSPASEALAGRYREARGHPQQMRAIVDRVVA
jgi:hypothetical protein